MNEAPPGLFFLYIYVRVYGNFVVSSRSQVKIVYFNLIQFK